MNNRHTVISALCSMLIFVLILGAVYLARVRDDEVVRTVENAGYSYVTPGEMYDLCGREYRIGRYWTALNAQGRESHGIVCCSAMLFASFCTVRFD